MLRGRVLFRRAAIEGKRLSGQLLRCSWLAVGPADLPRVQVGFKVPSATLNAVKRNRLRRLMREAFDKELPLLKASLNKRPKHIVAVVSYRGPKGMNVNEVTLDAVRSETQALCRSIASQV